MDQYIHVMQWSAVYPESEAILTLKAYNGVYSLQPLYALVHETEALAPLQLRSGNTHPEGKAIGFLHRLKKKIPLLVKNIQLRSDSALYDKRVIAFCEQAGWEFTITADQAGPLRCSVQGLSEPIWQPDSEHPALPYTELFYQSVGWQNPYRYLVRRERQAEKDGQGTLLERFSYDLVVTNRPGPVRALLQSYDRRGAAEKRMGQFTREFLSPLPMGGVMANWVYLLCGQLAYKLSLWICDLVLPPSYRKKHIKRIRRCIGLMAAKVTSSSHQIRLTVSVWHR